MDIDFTAVCKAILSSALQRDAGPAAKPGFVGKDPEGRKADRDRLSAAEA